MPGGDAFQTCVFFGYKTALQMLRAIPPCEWAPVKRAVLAFPERAPRSQELQHTIERIEAVYTGLRFEKPVHVLVSTPNCRAGKLCRPHVHAKDVPGTSFLHLGSGVACSKAELAFVHEATSARNAVSLLELGWELCGSYQTRRTGVASSYDVRPLTSVRALRAYVARNPSFCGAKKVARILPYLADGSASARETKLALVLGLGMAHGGGGLGIPRMNFEVAASPRARAISGRRSFRCDLCWPEAKLDVEYQSKENHRGEASRIRDSRRANALACMGWTVMHVTNDELDSLVAIDAVVEAIRRRLGKRLRVRVSDYHVRKLRLRRELGLPAGCD